MQKSGPPGEDLGTLLIIHRGGGGTNKNCVLTFSYKFYSYKLYFVCTFNKHDADEASATFFAFVSSNERVSGLPEQAITGSP